MEKKLYSLRGGLKKARKRKGIKQSDLADLMGVTLKTVMNWEQGIVNPDFETVMKLADKLDCDIDYLCGRLPESTHDIHFVHEFTGLSEEAIEKIMSRDGNNTFGKTLSAMIESHLFYNLITSYNIYHEFLATLKPSDVYDDRQWDELGEGKVVLTKRAAAKHFKQEVTSVMDQLCEFEFDEIASHVPRWMVELQKLSEQDKRKE